MLHRRWLLLLGFALLSCRRSEQTEPPQAQALSASNRGSYQAPKPSRLEEARTLALMTPSSATAVDRLLSKQTAMARANPRSAASWVELGRTWIAKARESSDPGYYLNADACAALAMDLSPADPLALDLRALVLLNDHRFREARELAQALVSRNPDSAMAWGTLSDALLELGELEAAERAANTMLELKPNLAAYTRISYLEWLHGNLPEATEAARLSIDAAGDPRAREPRAWALVQAAMLFWNQGDRDGADAGFELALSSFPEYPPALVGRARVALSKRDSARAVSLLQSAYEQSPLVETAWLLAEALEEAGHFSRAREFWAQAERRGQTHDRRTLSLLWSTQNSHAQQALELAESEHQLRADVYTEDALAWALYRNHRYREARAAIERAHRWNTPDPRLLFHHGAILAALGEKTKARHLIATALAKNPDFDRSSVQEARALLQSLSPGRS